MGSPCRLEGFTACPPAAPTWLTRHSICRKVTFFQCRQRGRDGAGQRRSWQKQINTSSFQLGLEIRAQSEEAEALTLLAPPLAFPGKPIRGLPIGRGELSLGAVPPGRSLLGENLLHFGMGKDRSEG